MNGWTKFKIDMLNRGFNYTQQWYLASHFTVVDRTSIGNPFAESQYIWSIGRPNKQKNLWLYPVSLWTRFKLELIVKRKKLLWKLHILFFRMRNNLTGLKAPRENVEYVRSLKWN